MQCITAAAPAGRWPLPRRLSCSSPRPIANGFALLPLGFRPAPTAQAALAVCVRAPMRRAHGLGERQLLVLRRAPSGLPRRRRRATLAR
jgi:hypothetical protein